MKEKTNKKPLLIVEDEPIIAEMYFNVFQTKPFEVLVAKTFEQGLLMFEEKLPFLVLLDLLIPQHGQPEPDYQGEPVGLNLLQRMRRHPKGRSSKIIVVTNLAEDLYRKKALDLGADYYFIKAQLDPHDLVKKVDGLSG